MGISSLSGIFEVTLEHNRILDCDGVLAILVEWPRVQNGISRSKDELFMSAWWSTAFLERCSTTDNGADTDETEVHCGGKEMTLNLAKHEIDGMKKDMKQHQKTSDKFTLRAIFEELPEEPVEI